MLAEIIIYIALFVALFSGAFSVAFQTVDTMKYIQSQKNEIDELHFLSAKLDAFIRSNPDWNNLSEREVMLSISGGSSFVEFVSSQILDTATSSSRVLLLTLKINEQSYVYSYVQNK